MKREYAAVIGFLVIGGFFLNSTAIKEENKVDMIFLYFASTQFGTCTDPESIERIKNIKTEFSEKYREASIKFVMVCLNHDFDKALKFIKKNGDWDEISIGKSFSNELALNLLNQSEIPKVPHIFVFKSRQEKGKWNLPLIKERELMADLAGKEQIKGWAEKDYPLPFRKEQTELTQTDPIKPPNYDKSD
ncbi:MAG: hypothetical protein GF421_10870 [Candidatus Aminicenantes bacterium]|nr:hypothetical protein [Candidatus Aminicenantes bacterium]